MVEREVQVLLFGCQMLARGLFYHQVSQEGVVHFGVFYPTDTREIHAVIHAITPVHVKFEMLSDSSSREHESLTLTDSNCDQVCACGT